MANKTTPRCANRTYAVPVCSSPVNSSALTARSIFVSVVSLSRLTVNHEERLDGAAVASTTAKLPSNLKRKVIIPARPLTRYSSLGGNDAEARDRGRE